MRRSKFTSFIDGRADTKMTPMIDCVFLLNIFFLLTSGFGADEGLLPTRLPAAGAVAANVEVPPEAQDLEVVRIALLWEGDRYAVELNGRRYARTEELRPVLVGDAQAPGLGRIAADLPVILDVADAVPLHHVVDVYDLCRLAGFRRLHFAVSQAPEGAGTQP